MAGRYYTAALLAAALHLATASAYADVAGPPVEDCTRAEVEADEEYCESVSAYGADLYGCRLATLETLRNEQADPSACGDGSSPTDADCCQVWLEAGWTYRCRSNPEASGEYAMWCRERKEGDPPRPADEIPYWDEVTKGCSIDAARTTGMYVAALLLALAGIGLLRRRSRRNPRR